MPSSPSYDSAPRMAREAAPTTERNLKVFPRQRRIADSVRRFCGGCQSRSEPTWCAWAGLSLRKRGSRGCG